MTSDKELGEKVRKLEAELKTAKGSSNSQYALAPKKGYASQSSYMPGLDESLGQVKPYAQNLPSATDMMANAMTQMYAVGAAYFQAATAYAKEMTNMIKELKGLYQMDGGMKPAYAGAPAKGYDGPATYSKPAKR